MYIIVQEEYVQQNKILTYDYKYSIKILLDVPIWLQH